MIRAERVFTLHGLLGYVAGYAFAPHVWRETLAAEIFDLKCVIL